VFEAGVRLSLPAAEAASRPWDDRLRLCPAAIRSPARPTLACIAVALIGRSGAASIQDPDAGASAGGRV